MPTYEYRCRCGLDFEVQQGINSKPIATCPGCGQKTTHRLISKIGGIVFKGKGWIDKDLKRGNNGT